uniref:Uncharacterized protein n=1 Tax=Strombidium inclinatum TaxID=197538 RepID=A0A7S3N143_9SPIT|mmetsp:Transcript_37464/g.57373  ORF Transcript_37464/g.57373 Transcript_37464/m.57373 type:complete len:317 (+) Transcript_37464:342-1292(+)
MAEGRDAVVPRSRPLFVVAVAVLVVEDGLVQGVGLTLRATVDEVDLLLLYLQVLQETVLGHCFCGRQLGHGAPVVLGRLDHGHRLAQFRPHRIALVQAVRNRNSWRSNRAVDGGKASQFHNAPVVKHRLFARVGVTAVLLRKDRRFRVEGHESRRVVNGALAHYARQLLVDCSLLLEQRVDLWQGLRGWREHDSSPAVFSYSDAAGDEGQTLVLVRLGDLLGELVSHLQAVDRRRQGLGLLWKRILVELLLQGSNLALKRFRRRGAGFDSRGSPLLARTAQRSFRNDQGLHLFEGDDVLLYEVLLRRRDFGFARKA